MTQDDIKYILELVKDAISEKNWELVSDAEDALKEFLDTDEAPEED